MIKFRNVDVLSAAPAHETEEPTLPRLRAVTNSPEMEYERRGGVVQPIGDDIAALIVAEKRSAEVRRDEIVIREGKDTFKFSAVGSLTCQTKEGQRVLVVYNGAERTHGANGPSCVHVLTNDCEYVETLYRKDRAAPFDQESSARAISHANRSIAASRQRLEIIHGKDIKELVEAAQQNAAEMRAAVTQLPAPAAARTENAPAASTERSRAVAEALHRGGRRKGDQGRDTTQFWARRATTPEAVTT